MIQAASFGSTGIAVPLVGQGTWHLDTEPPKAALSALSAGIEAGLTHIDTAEMYGDGAAEELVAKAIAGKRDRVFLVSKILPHHATASAARAACEASLRRLKVEGLDCYLLHWPPSHPVEEAVAELEALTVAGKIRSWGVSNFDEDELARVLKLVGPGKIACNQVLYHVKERAIEHAVLPFCRAHGIAVVGYSPFGSGDFPLKASSGGKALESVGLKHNVTAHQVALAFLLRTREVFVIPKAATAEHTLQNAAAANLELGPDDLAILEAAFPRGRRRRGIPML